MVMLTQTVVDDKIGEHTSELQSRRYISYAVFCLRKDHKKTAPPREKQYPIQDWQVSRQSV